MDDCIRWLLLYRAVEIGDDRNIQLIDMIMRKNPRLAFSETTTPSLVKKCRVPQSQKGSKVKTGSAMGSSRKKKNSHFDANAKTPSAESLFSIAVRMGRDRVVEVILKRTKRYLEEQETETDAGEELLKLAREDSKNTAMKAAIRAGGDAIDAVDMVLRILPEFITHDDTVLSCAIEESSTEFIEKFISHQQSCGLLTSRENIIKALETAGNADEDSEEDAIYVAQKILEASSTDEHFSLEVIGTVMKYDLMNLWTEKDRIEVEKMPCLLHMAVLHKRADFAKELLERNPELALQAVEVPVSGIRSSDGVNGSGNGNTKADTKRYALWYNNYTLDDKPQDRSDTRKKIRSALVYYIVKYAPNMRELSGILEKSGEPERELSFDMSRLNFEHGRVSEFFQSFSLHDRSRRLLKYEETIRYAEFPVLDLRADEHEWPQNHAYVSTAHTEVFDTLDWLANHGVRRIISLKVPDRMMNPHDEERIADTVRRFRVEELDWRFLDLSLNIFQPHGRDEDRSIDLPPLTDRMKSKLTATRNEPRSRPKTFLTRLHLYSSGKRSALHHWFGSEGIRTMHLNHLHIHIVNELLTQPAAKATTAYIRSEVSHISEQQSQLESYVDPEFWNPTHQLVHLNEIAQRLSPRLAQFTEYYRKFALAKYQRTMNHPDKYPATKVAIIDNGILTVAPQESSSNGNNNNNGNNTIYTNSDADLGSGGGGNRRSTEFFEKRSLWSRICEGKSFVDSKDRASPWFLASNPHGTQMANLLCAIDPLCELYVAKIADGKYGYSAERATEAVKWAIAKDVDIISMSFTTEVASEEFTKALSKASEEGIILVCSLHDEGERVDTVYPADAVVTSNRKLRMTGCDEFGKLKPDIEKSRYDFCISSQNVAAGVIPFLTTNEPISGSSVATALGAGLCSLILSCEWVAKKSKKLNAVSTAADRHDTRMANKAARFDRVKRHLEQMLLNTSTKFLILERFAGLDQIKEINNSTLEKALLSVGDDVGKSRT